jgi:MFS family permease
MKQEKLKEILIFVYSIIIIFFMSGVIYGWSSMTLVYQDEGVFSKTNNQGYYLSQIFSTSQIALLIQQFLNGYLLDKWGARIHISLGSFLFSLGLSFLSLSKCNYNHNV